MLYGVLRIVLQVEQISVLLAYITVGYQTLLYQVYKAFTVFPTKKDNRNICDFLSLNKCQCFKKFIQRTKPAWKRDKFLIVLYKHHFSHKKVFKVDHIFRR